MSASIHEALKTFADSVMRQMAQPIVGAPEDQLRTPFKIFMEDGVGSSWGGKIVCSGEAALPGRLGRPDYVVQLNQLPVGYVELKAPGIGAIASRFKGRNRNQFERFSAVPNILYSDGNEWALYRDGDLVDHVVHLSGDIVSDGKRAITEQDADKLKRLLLNFLQWEPFLPTDRRGKIDLKGFAELVAPICRMLRNDVADALKDGKSPLIQLAHQWRDLLFPDAIDDQFADAYAQAVTFALLLGRSEGADPLTLLNARVALATQHNLLSRALEVLTDDKVLKEIFYSIELVRRIIGTVPPSTLTTSDDLWLYFYEDFLAAYDPDLRKKAGAYYTPTEIVRAQVCLVDDLLVNRFGKQLGFANPDVITLDPAAGTGTYLLGVIECAFKRIKEKQGAGAVAGQATALAKNLYGFEFMVGPYAVTELRVSQALREHGASLSEDGTNIYLTNTLESPHAEPPQAIMGFAQGTFAEQHKRATQIKADVPVIVCLGNPPYRRHEAIDDTKKLQSGGWIYWGDSGNPLDGIIKDFREPAIKSGHGVHVRNMYNFYVYFWRWALWKVFEHAEKPGPGIVNFITASSYIDGPGFCGMREHMRRVCDEIWVLDLGGEGRGARQSDNVFSIKTPVAITIAVCSNVVEKDKPAKVHYFRMEGSRATKLAILASLTNIECVEWEDCPDGWQESFRPAGKGSYFSWPLLTDLMPWQIPGLKMHRTWPICHDPDTLAVRWGGLLNSEDMVKAFRETDDRKISGKYNSIHGVRMEPLLKLPKDTPPPEIERYAYRSFDRQWIIADSRLGDRFRPDLWRAHGEKQVYLTSLLTQCMGAGPALTSCAQIPDLHHFGAGGAKDIIPLYRTLDALEVNIMPGLLDFLGKAYKRTVAPEDFLAYVYGALAQSSFTARFMKELEGRKLHVPITKDVALFEKIRAIGADLLFLHTYGERFVSKGKRRGIIQDGKAKCAKSIPSNAAGYPEDFKYYPEIQMLRVGTGEFSNVTPDVYEFEVSSLKVVQSWLKYRMKKGAGKKSSPLDDIRPESWTSQLTTELLELLWVLEETIKEYPKQAKLLDAVIEGDCFQADELPPVPDKMRKPSKAQPLLDRIK